MCKIGGFGGKLDLDVEISIFFKDIFLTLYPPLSDFLLSLWMTGNKDIKLNFMSSHSILMSAESTTIFEKAAIHPMCFYLNF